MHVFIAILLFFIVSLLFGDGAGLVLWVCLAVFGYISWFAFFVSLTAYIVVAIILVGD